MLVYDCMTISNKISTVLLSSPIFLVYSNKAIVNLSYSVEAELGFYVYVEDKYLL